MIPALLRPWSRFAERRPETAQFIVFMGVNTAMTVLQLALMPVLKSWFNGTELVDVSVQVMPIGDTFVFDYPAGALPDGGGGLAYFLAVQLTIAVAQTINFFLQRNVTFKSNTNPWRAAAWYVLAYVVITFVAAVAQGFYKTPIYDLFIDTWGLGATGETLGDVTTMLINAGISVLVFYPIFKVIFGREAEGDRELASAV
ncbi:hypothetical protein [Demequina sp. NBRC 110057]|uniref:hypothetical protein n=1 Tax=Demequina sp. NBRC 110057 TaxID=1570346 RepID=UPI0011784450|nr:hypothetical protein [Demequina sp. NBRC 110057]